MIVLTAIVAQKTPNKLTNIATALVISSLNASNAMFQFKFAYLMVGGGVCVARVWGACIKQNLRNLRPQKN